MNLSEIKSDWAEIKLVGGEGELRQHFLDMGLIPGTKVKLKKYAPSGDPMEIFVRGYSLTLRLEDAKKIEIIDTAPEPQVKNIIKKEIPHPGLGEGGKYHTEKKPVNLDKTLTFALVGNQNSGKTTLFNALTGSNQHVGNFPGVTVDRKSGSIIGFPKTEVVDLPGIYSLSPYSSEEIVSRDFVLNERPDGIINIVDATNIERNLYLTMQLLELQIPMVIALNMMDELLGNHGSVDINAMEEALGVPVVPISASQGKGIEELISHAIHVAKYEEPPKRIDFCEDKSPLHRSIHGVMHLIDDHAKIANIPLRFAASKVIEGDSLILKALKLDKNEEEMIEHIILQMESERGLDRMSAIADMRFSFIEKLTRLTVQKPEESRERKRSENLDELFTGKYTAIPIFILIMGAVFFLTFNVIGAFLQDLLETGINNLSSTVKAMLLSADVNSVIRDLIVDGIFQGVGSVVSFLPIIVVMFFFLSLLEDSGYVARVAFFMDSFLRKLGLSGRSIVPMLIGFGCTVPAVMSSRTLPSSRDRKMTILLTPFMSCSAKLPIYGFLCTIFFPKFSGLIMTGLYFLGITVGVIVALIYNKTLFKGEAAPFVMELPNYRLPSMKNVGILLMEKSKDFLSRAFSVILIATIIMWFLNAFDLRLNRVALGGQSILAEISGFLTPFFKPIGLGDYRLVASLISGIMAKESVVSSMQLLFNDTGVEVLAKPQIVSLLVFSLLYTPCIAAIYSIMRELGRGYAAFSAIFQFFIAYILAGVAWFVSGGIL